MTTETYYIKRGRRYQPVSWYDSNLTDALHAGHYLLSVHPGGRSMRAVISPERARLFAAAHEMREAMVLAMLKASELSPQRKPLTSRQIEAWQALADAFGDELATLNVASAHDIVEAGILALEGSIK